MKKRNGMLPLVQQHLEELPPESEGSLALPETNMKQSLDTSRSA